MGVAASNRGNRVIARECDAALAASGVVARGERQAHKDEVARLREEIAVLERDLGRARRCIAELRRSKEGRLSEMRADLASSRSAISILCRVAFPAEVL